MKEENADSEIFSLADATRFLHVSISTLYRLRCSGRLKTVRIGRRVFVRRSDLTAIIENETPSDGR